MKKVVFCPSCGLHHFTRNDDPEVPVRCIECGTIFVLGDAPTSQPLSPDDYKIKHGFRLPNKWEM